MNFPHIIILLVLLSSSSIFKAMEHSNYQTYPSSSSSSGFSSPTFVVEEEEEEANVGAKSPLNESILAGSFIACADHFRYLKPLNGSSPYRLIAYFLCNEPREISNLTFNGHSLPFWAAHVYKKDFESLAPFFFLLGLSTPSCKPTKFIKQNRGKEVKKSANTLFDDKNHCDNETIGKAISDFREILKDVKNELRTSGKFFVLPNQKDALKKITEEWLWPKIFAFSFFLQNMIEEAEEKDSDISPKDIKPFDYYLKVLRDLIINIPERHQSARGKEVFCYGKKPTASFSFTFFTKNHCVEPCTYWEDNRRAYCNKTMPSIQKLRKKLDTLTINGISLDKLQLILINLLNSFKFRSQAFHSPNCLIRVSEKERQNFKDNVTNRLMLSLNNIYGDSNKVNSKSLLIKYNNLINVSTESYALRLELAKQARDHLPGLNRNFLQRTGVWNQWDRALAQFIRSRLYNKGIMDYISATERLFLFPFPNKYIRFIEEMSDKRILEYLSDVYTALYFKNFIKNLKFSSLKNFKPSPAQHNEYELLKKFKVFTHPKKRFKGFTNSTFFPHYLVPL